MTAPRGFTLVEIIVSLTLLSMLTVLVLSSVRMLGDSQQRLEATVERLDEMRLVSRFLRNSLRQAFLVPAANSNLPFFEGQSRDLQWVAPLRGAEGFAGLHFMRLAYRDGVLAIQFAPYDADSVGPDWQNARVFPLLTRVNEFELNYRGERGDPWLPRWDDGFRGPPGWVKLRLRVRERYWPELVVGMDQLRVQP